MHKKGQTTVPFGLHFLNKRLENSTVIITLNVSIWLHCNVIHKEQCKQWNGSLGMSFQVTKMSQLILS